MSGLIDFTTGLSAGTGLQSQTAIGGAGLVATTGGETPELELLWGTDFLKWDTLFLTWGME